MKPAGGFLSIPGAVLLAALFFAPWQEVSCANQAVGRVSGYQLATGGMTLEDNASPYALREVSEHAHPRWWFALGLALPVMVAGARVLSVRGPLPAACACLLTAAAGLAGIALMTAATHMDYTEDIRAALNGQGSPPRLTLSPRAAKAAAARPPRPANPPPQLRRQMLSQAATLVKVRPTTYALASLGLYGVLAAAGAIGLLSLRGRRREPAVMNGNGHGPAAFISAPPPARASPRTPARPAGQSSAPNDTCMGLRIFNPRKDA